MSNNPQEESYEIFISYSHRDDVPPPHQRDIGWVTHFHRHLEHLLREWLLEPTIWRDDALRASDVIDETVLKPLPHASVLIAIISPNYVNSLWCERELDEFHKAAEKTGLGVQVLNRMRIFKVAKVPLLKGQQLHEVFAKVKGFDFYDAKDKNKKPIFFGPDESTEEARRFFHGRVGDVAWEVKQMLEFLEDLAEKEHLPVEEQTKSQSQSTAVGVYLAETTPDLNDQRDNVRRDLLHRGYSIVQLSAEDAAAGTRKLQAKIAADLKDCRFSIHLIGDMFGTCPPDNTTSIVEIQDAVAAAHAAQYPDFQRLIWIPDGVKPQHTSQWRFVNVLLDSNFARNTELLRRSLENFKTVIEDKTATPPAAAMDRVAGGASWRGVSTVGIICDRLDSEQVGRLDDCLFEHGCDVVVAFVDGASATLTEDDVKSLSVCDGIIIYMDGAPLFWVQGRLQDITAIEQQAATEFRAVAVYVGGRKDETKERFRTRKAVVIKNFEDAPEALLGPIPPHLLQPFLDKLDDKERGKVS